MAELRHLGLVVHPTRSLDHVLDAIRDWSSAHDVEVRQVRIADQSREVAAPIDASDCDLLLAVGGDGTALHALRAGAAVARPVLGVACGSIGMLTAITADHVVDALAKVASGDYAVRPVPGLEVAVGEAPIGAAVNDLVIVRAGVGQVLAGIEVDEVLYARVAGDGVVVASALGSSAYSMAAGGPIFAPGAEGIVVTPLAPHGGCAPPLVTAAGSVVRLSLQHGHGGVRWELDGQPMDPQPKEVTVRHRPDYATIVELAGQEPRLTGLRRRGLVLDGPRVLVRDRQEAR
jgi:NAD+ kinase